MKLSLDCTFPPDPVGKRLTVPIQFVRIGAGVMDKLVERLQTYRYDDHVELIKIKFTGGEQAAFMVISAIIRFQLVDLKAESRETLEREDILELGKTVADNAIERNVKAFGEQINATIHQMLNTFGQNKVRFMKGHKVVEPV